ncbi:MAG: ArsR family transcriptional regulator [Thermodesulfobacteriota bacterium]
MSYQDIQTAHMRLAILLLLAKDNGFDLNEHLLRDLLRSYGHNLGQDRLRTELSWLAEQCLVKTADLEGTWVARLTNRGLEVTEGRATVPGVKRPGPEGF